ncbi:MAG: hypothetical protein IPJ27_22535 [Candidatus Accumulibacter sp.]|uniref:Lipocalin-like domain-containing protein n=1 Tax=Candidatus Accumulibacter proximus TaxID=2954385 RepID=A0A935Q4A8_9PROT|nr:hypothetical protein [Candidatus Accumulibacter proximus]
MRWSNKSSRCHYPSGIALLGVLLVTACGQPASPPASQTASQTATVAADEVRNFTGDWTVVGSRRVVDLVPGQQAGIFQVRGSMMLSGKQRLHRAFQAEAIGFSDATTGLHGRSVWTDEHGDKVFSELSGEGFGPSQLIEGKFTGGTGRYAGVSGEYSFKWQRLGAIEGDELAGRVVDLKGWARLASPNVVSPTAAGGQK